MIIAAKRTGAIAVEDDAGLALGAEKPQLAAGERESTGQIDEANRLWCLELD